MERDRRRDAAARGLAGARRQRAIDHHVHLRHDRDAQGRDAQLRDLRLVDRRRPEARAARQQRAAAELPAAGARRRARPDRACAAGDRHARLLRREPGHLHHRPAARPADRVLLGAAAVGQVPAGGRGEDAAGQAAAAAAHPDRAPAGGEEGARRARPRCLQLRRRRRGTDAARSPALVHAPRPADRRGLRHDRELRRLARHAARHRALRHRRPAVRRRADAASTRRAARSR